MGSISDTYLAYQFIKRLTMPFVNWEAFKLGVIDETGKSLIKRNKLTTDQRNAWGRFDVLVANLKRLLAKLPGGQTRLATIAATVMLLKEYHEPTQGELDVDILAEQLDDHIVASKIYENEDMQSTDLLEGFKILGKTTQPEGTGIPHHVDTWHQSRGNGWCVQVLDKHGNQVGDAEYHYHKSDANRARKELSAHHGLNEQLDTTSLIEDAAANCAGGGAVAAIGVGPQGEPGMGKNALAKYKKKNKTLPNTSLFTRKSIG